MTRDLIQHVIEEGDACIELGKPCPVEIEGDRDIGFEGTTLEFCGSQG